MKYINLVVAISLLLVTNSCIEHEVIPPPKPVVELECSFSATVDGTPYSLVMDVNGMYCESTKSKEINPSPQPSTATYNATMKSDVQLDFVQISLGKLNFNADVDADPSLEQFTTFFNANANPDYSLGANTGVEVVFRDAAGNVWYSDPSSTDPLTFSFTSLVQESDESGDYMKFQAAFTCTMVDDLVTPTASLTVENAVFKAHFKR